VRATSTNFEDSRTSALSRRADRDRAVVAEQTQQRETVLERTKKREAAAEKDRQREVVATAAEAGAEYAAAGDVDRMPRGSAAEAPRRVFSSGAKRAASSDASEGQQRPWQPSGEGSSESRRRREETPEVPPWNSEFERDQYIGSLDFHDWQNNCWHCGLPGHTKWYCPH